MSEFRKIVENILKEYGYDLYDFETAEVVPSPVCYDKYKNQIQNDIKNDILTKADELDTYFENITADDIRKILNEKDNTPKREHDLAEIKRYTYVLLNTLKNYIETNIYFNKPQKEIMFKTIDLFPNLCLAPKISNGKGHYDEKTDTVYLFVLNNDGTYDPNELIDLLINGSLEHTIVHELTHRQEIKDCKAKSEPFGFISNSDPHAYANNEREINAFTNQIISYIEKDLKQTTMNIRLNRSKQGNPISWKNAIMMAINLLLRDLKNQNFKMTLEKMSDDTLKKIYRTIYEYFYKQYFEQYVVTNPDQYNQELKNIK